MDPVLYGNRPRSYLNASLRCSHYTTSILRTHRTLSIATAPLTSDNTVMLSGTDYSNALSPRWLQLRAPPGATDTTSLQHQKHGLSKPMLSAHDLPPSSSASLQGWRKYQNVSPEDLPGMTKRAERRVLRLSVVQLASTIK